MTAPDRGYTGRTHPEHELLSALIDAELIDTVLIEDVLEDDARTEIAAHVAACLECADTLEGLRFAREALRRLPRPEMNELHAKQVLRELNRARRRPATRWRALVAVGGTAAAIAAFAGITMLGTSSGPNVLATGIELERIHTDFSEAELEAFLARTVVSPQLSDNAVGLSPYGGPADSTVGASTAMPMPSNPPAATSGRTVTAPGPEAVVVTSGSSREKDQVNHGAQIARCEERIRPGGDGGAVARRYVVAWFEDIASYILVYDAPRKQPDHLEVWVVARSDCRVLYQATR